MPIVAVSNGVRPEFRALAVIELNKPVTPDEINAHVGTGNYAAKYISFLRRAGFVFTATKVGRTIVSYTLVGEPADVAKYRNMAPKQKAVKAPKVAKPAKGQLPKHTVVRAAKPAAVKTAAASFMSKRNKAKADAVTKQFGSSGEVSSFGVDADWDSMEGINVRDLVA